MDAIPNLKEINDITIKAIECRKKVRMEIISAGQYGKGSITYNFADTVNVVYESILEELKKLGYIIYSDDKSCVIISWMN